MKNHPSLNRWHQQMIGGDASQKNKAIGELYLYYYQSVLPNLNSQYKSFTRQEVEDVLSLAFETLLKNTEKLRLKYPRSVLQYLNTIIRNEFYHRNKRSQRTQLKSDYLITTTVETAIIQQEESRRLQLLVARLKPLKKSILFGWAKQDLTLKEIAAQSGYNYSYTRRMKSAAIDELRTLFFA